MKKKIVALMPLCLSAPVCACVCAVCSSTVAAEERVAISSSTRCPAYAWRGFHLDEARHFFGKETVKDYLDHLHRLRLNVLHWHLTDDQGWRLDVPGFPELVKYGAVRSSTDGDGKTYGPFFYTAADVKEIVAYASARGIRVVPEIEIPGHVRALLAAHPEFSCTGDLKREAWTEWGICEDVLCAGNETAVAYYERVLDAVMAMFPSEFIHIGGDECPKKRWKACPKCQARMKALGLKDEEALQGWLTTRIVRHVASKGRRAIGWDEILAGGDLPKGTLIQCWRDARFVREAAERGYDVIASPCESCYFTFAEGLPDDPYRYRSWTKGKTLSAAKMLRFDPRAGIPPELQGRIIGGECCLWSEYVHDREELDYKVLNRLDAFAKALDPDRRYAPIPPLAVTNICVEIGLKRPFSVLHVSDSHLSRIDSRSDGRLYDFARKRSSNGRELGEHYLNAAFEHAHGKGLKVVHSGDVMEFASAANLEYAERRFRSEDAIACPGNHEYWDGASTDVAQLRPTMGPNLRSVFGAEASVTVVGGVTFFAFDNASGRVSAEVVAAFERAVAAKRPIVLVCHVPLPIDGLEDLFPFLKDAFCDSYDETTADFVDRVRAEPLVRAVLCGHLHTPLEMPFSPTANQYVAGALFDGQAREILFR